MKVIETKLNGVWIFEPQIINDHRGFFAESYNKQRLQEHGIDYEFIQDNHSMCVESATLRGLHFQSSPKAQTKLIRVVSGSVYDVAVDIRPESATFGQWIGVILSVENMRQLLIPKGFAHGYCTLRPNTHLLYKVDEYYAPEHDSGIAWNDPDLAIPWPVSQIILSEKDRLLPRLRDLNLTMSKEVNVG